MHFIVLSHHINHIYVLYKCGMELGVLMMLDDETQLEMLEELDDIFPPGVLEMILPWFHSSLVTTYRYN